MFPPGNAPVAEAVAAHREHRQAWYASMIGPLVVPDQRPSTRLRAHGPTPTATVSVINTGGAGGLLGLARRDLPGVRVVAVESALRDLDDLAGNAARVASAAGELDEDGRRLRGDPVRAGLGTGGGRGRGGRAARQDPHRQPGRLRHPAVRPAGRAAQRAGRGRPAVQGDGRPAPRAADAGARPGPAALSTASSTCWPRSRRWSRGPRWRRRPTRSRPPIRRRSAPGASATVARVAPAVPQLRLLRRARPGPRPGRPRTGGGAGMSGFTDELPYGVFSRPGRAAAGRRGASASQVLDLGAALPRGELDPADFAQPSLNAFLARGPGGLGGDPGRSAAAAGATRRPLEPHLVPLREVRLHLPIEVADYVDFYASEHHAEQRGPDLPAGRPAADAELEAHADRLPRPGRHGGGLGHRRRSGRAGSSRPRATRRRGSGRAASWTSRPSWAGWSGWARRSGSRSRSTASPSTCSAW